MKTETNISIENKRQKQDIERLNRELKDYKDALISQLRINVDNEKKVRLAKEITLINLKKLRNG